MSRATVTERGFALAASAACVALLAVAAQLHPDEAGHGTHRQLGLPPCGWVVVFDRPCPTCGMTTAFAAAADGRHVDAARTQPLGAALAVVTAGVAVAGVHKAWTGVRPARVLRPVLGRWALWAGGASILAAWGYKMLTWG